MASITIAPVNFVAPLAARAADLAPIMPAIGERVRADVLRNFREGGWYPQKWRPSRRAAGGGRTTLVQSAILRNSFHVVASGNSVTVGTDVPYAATHQAGATIVARKTITITPKNGGLLRWKVGNRWVSKRSVTQTLLRWKVGNRWCAKRSVTIPARPMLPVDATGALHPTTLGALGRLVARWVSRADRGASA